MVTDQGFQHPNKRVRVLESKVEFLYQHLGATYVLKPGPADDPELLSWSKKVKNSMPLSYTVKLPTKACTMLSRNWTIYSADWGFDQPRLDPASRRGF